jgi:hypothetical protein
MRRAAPAARIRAATESPSRALVLSAAFDATQLPLGGAVLLQHFPEAPMRRKIRTRGPPRRSLDYEGPAAAGPQLNTRRSRTLTQIF